MKNPLQGAIVGFGFIAEKGHLPAYLSRNGAATGLEIVAIADVCAARRDIAHQMLPSARIYPDVTALLAGEAGTLDFLDITTPPCDHAAIAHAALDAGLHVLCEKPLATSTEEARSMLDHALRAKRVLFPSHNYKHAPVIRAVRGVLDADRIGPVHLVTLDTFRTTHARGVAEWQPDWRRTRRISGGGIAMDHGSHTFYLAFEWLASYPTAITARMSRRGTFDTEDGFSCTVQFPTGTAVAQLTWNAGVRKVIYTLHGRRGAITVIDDDIEIAIRGSGGAPAEIERLSVASNWMDASHAVWFRSLFDQFAAAIQAEDFVGREAQESLLCIQLIETAYQSARGGSRELPLASEWSSVASIAS